MPPSVASAWIRIATSILLLATALVGGVIGSPSSSAAPPPMSVNCSDYVGNVSTDDSFNAAVTKVNAGLCNIITITNSIYLATQKTIDADMVASLTLTSNPPGSTLTSAPRQGVVINTTDDTNLDLMVSNLTFSGFDDSVGTASALTAESLADLTVVLTNVSFINNFGGDAPGAANLSAGGSANITINGYSSFQGNRTRSNAPGGAVRIGAGAGSTVTIGSPGDDSVSFLSNTSLTQSGGAIAVTGATGSGINHQLTTHGGTFADDSAAWAGGAIYTVGSATLNSTDFTNNTASGDVAGAVYAGESVVVNGGTFHGNRAGGAGGAVSAGGNDTTSQITNATFTDNLAGGHGGAVRALGLLTVTGSTFRDDSAGGSGGAIAADDTITITGSLFQDDTASNSGGAVSSVFASVLSQGSTYRANRAVNDGGAISAPNRVTSTDDTFFGNWTSFYDGGAIEAGRVTTTGSRFTSNRAQDHGGAIAAGSLDDSGSTFIGNRSLKNGGAVNLGQPSTFTGSTFRDDSAGLSGGAIYSGGSLTITGSLFEDDTAAHSGGAIYADDTLFVTSSTFGQNVGFLSAGAIRVDDTSTIVNSLFQDNEARGPNPGSNGYGGAIVSGVSGASTTITRTTFTANRARQEGGALSAAGPVTLTDDTFTSNSSTNLEGGGMHVAAPGTVVATRTSFASNTSGGDGGAIRVDGTATLTSSTFELNRTTTAGKNGGAVSASGDVVLTETDFTSNHSTQWGGAVQTGGSATVTDSTFHGNTTQGRGGALFIDDTGTIARSNFTDDTSVDNGGAITVTDLVMQSSSLAGNQSGYGGAVHAWRSASITNSTFEDNYGSWGGAISLANSSVPSRIAYSTLLNNRAYVAGAISQGSAITATATTPIALTGSVLAGAGSLCADDTTGLRDLNLTADSAYSFATDTSCSGGVPGNADDSINTSYTTDDSLGLTASLTTDDTPGMQVVIPDDTAVVNAYVPLSTLPSITTDQLNGLRNSPNGLTSAGAVQVRPTSVAGPSSITVAPGSNATFSVTGYPGIGPTMTYRWQTSANGTTWYDDPGVQTSTFTLPSVSQSQSGLQVRVLVADAYGNDDTSAVATLTVSAPAPPPNPDPGTPPSAPRDPRATAGDARATVTWSAPLQPGSFPVTSYEVRSDVDSATCLVTVTSATPLECTVTGLTNDVAYRFSVRALNAAGWGPWSTWSAAVSPEARDSIMITGSRQGRDAVVTGTTQGLDGEQVRAMVRFPGQTSFTAGSRRPVDDKGRFTWQRSTGKKVAVYFTHGQTASNRVSIPARHT